LSDSQERRIHEHEFDSRFHQQNEFPFGARDHSAPLLLKSKGVAIFALIDHSGEAEKAGLKMRPTQLLIFGNPKAG